MAINKRQFYIYEISTFSTFTKKENDLYNCIKSKENVAKNKDILNKSIKNNKKQRKIRKNSLNEKHLISLFENDLIRWIEVNKPNYISYNKTANGKDKNIVNGIITMKIKNFDILNQIIDKGLILDGKKYVTDTNDFKFYTASAGQIRHDKIALVEQSIIDEYEPKIMCGLSVEKINSMGGVNNSKYFAYKSLPLSASLPIVIDVNKTVVVPDMEIAVDKEVEYIDNKTFESKIINLKDKGIKLDQTDGCGIILPTLNNKIKEQLHMDYPLTGFQIRAPWIKGALFPFDFKEFCKDKNTIVTDIYGKKYDIVKDDIQIIFTESQFKMHKFYSSWDEYKKYFIENNLNFSITATNNNFVDKTQMSYQFLQTLDRDKMTDKNIEGICKPTIDYIKDLHNNLDEVYKVFGADKTNKHLTPIQEAMLIYPKILNDNWFKEQIKKKVKSVRKYALAAKLRMQGFYGYMMPDMYAFCEWLFAENKDNYVPVGLLVDGEICCHYYVDKNIQECDLLRSPHLYNEHTVRKISHSEECKKWFKYCGQNIIYSIHDFVALSVQGDVDGDQLALVPKTKDNEAYFNSIKPHYVLYYEMFKAPAQQLNKENIYHTLLLGYKNNESGNSIGDISNAISKLWNSDELTEDTIKMIKLLTMYNNFTIDYAKTNANIELPENVKNKYEELLKSHVPYFFRWAKDKKSSCCADSNNSVINQLNSYINSNTRGLKFNLKSNTDKNTDFDYSILQSRKGDNIYPTVICDDKYQAVQRILRQCNIKIGEYSKYAKEYNRNIDFDIVYSLCYQELIGVYSHGNMESPIEKLVNTLIDIIYCQYETIPNSKNILWNCFGNVVVNNIKNNINLKGYKPVSRTRITTNVEDIQEIKSKLEEKVQDNSVYICRDDIDLLNKIELDGSKKIMFSLIILRKLFNIGKSQNEKHNVIYLNEGKNSKFNKHKLCNMSNVPDSMFDKYISYLQDNKFINIITDNNKVLVKLNNEEVYTNRVILITNVWNCNIYYDYYFNHKPIEKCIICGNDFIKKTHTQRTCSKKCSKLLEKQYQNKYYNCKNA